MSDRNKFLGGMFVLALLVLGFWIWFVPTSPEAIQPPPQPLPVESKAAIPSSIPRIPITPAEQKEVRKRNEEEVRIREESVKNMRKQFRTPIVFYGKVIDEKNQPVVGAQVKYSANSIDPTLTQEVHYEGEVYSDAAGKFKIDGIMGVALGLNEVTHPGYYASTKNKDGAGYAMGRDSKVPDTEEKAWVFRMYKKKEPVALIVGSGGIKVPVNGTSGVIRLGAQSQLQVEAWASPPPKYTGKPFDWRVRLSVPGGGLIESTEEFNFEAPLSGYQSFVEIDMPSGKEGWTESVRKTYILNLGNTYARMSAYVNSGKQVFVSVNYLINPTGHRNLEYDPAKKIDGP